MHFSYRKILACITLFSFRLKYFSSSPLSIPFLCIYRLSPIHNIHFVVALDYVEPVSFQLACNKKGATNLETTTTTITIIKI